MDKTFRQEYLNEYHEEEYLEPAIYWLAYYLNTELYDRSISTPDGIPKHYLDRSRMTDYARQTKQFLKSEKQFQSELYLNSNSYYDQKMWALRLVESNIDLALEKFKEISGESFEDFMKPRPKAVENWKDFINEHDFLDKI